MRSSFLLDAWLGVRSLRRKPGIPLLATLTLGVGLALVAAQYTAVHALLFQRLPFDPDGTMLSLRWSQPLGMRANRPGARELRELAQRQRSFATVTGFGYDRVGHSVRLEDGQWVQREGLSVLPDFLSQMGARLSVGRLLEPADHHPGANPVVVISDRFWRDLGREPRVLGTTISFDHQRWTIVGVVQPGFEIDGEAFWAPNIDRPDDGAVRRPIVALASLRAGVTLPQAREELNRLTRELGLSVEQSRRLGHLEALPARQDLLDARTVELYWLMLLPVVLVLVCAATNVSHLLLARASARRHELALRSSLGATRARLVRQMLGEALPVGLASSLLGLTLAALLTPLARAPAAMVPLPAWIHPSLNGAVIVVMVCLSLAVTLAAALIPALRASRLDLAAAMKEDARTSTGLHATRTSSIFSVVQLALSAGVLFVAFSAALTVDSRARRPLRVDPKAYLTTNVFFPRDEFPDEQRVHDLILSLDRSLRALPGGLEGALSSRRALSQGQETRVQTKAGESPDEGVVAFEAHVGLGYFEALGVPLLAGRAFSEGDGESAGRVAVVDAAFAARFWPGEAAVGRHFEVSRRGAAPVSLLVVGVVPGLQMGGAADPNPDAPGFFTPLAQITGWRSVFPFVTGGRPGADRALLAAVRSIDPEGHPRRTFTFWEDLDRRQAGLRILGQLFAAFGLAALVLGAAGMYGLMSLTVRQRVREIGTRMALGASSGAILWQFLLRSARQVALGLSLGMGLGWLLTAVVEKKIGPLGMSAPAGVLVAGTLAAASLLATVWPSLRAARLSPAAALQSGH